MERKFVHLRTTSENSISKGLLSVDKIISLAKENNQDSVAITDDCKTIGVIQHYINARKQGLKPIIGVDIYIEPDVTKMAGTDLNKILLIAKNNNGYENLLTLISRAHQENQSNGKAAIKESWLVETDLAKDLICLSGSFKDSEIAQMTLEVIDEKEDKDVKKIKYQNLLKTIKFYKDVFKEDFYLEIQRYGYEREDEIINAYLQNSVINQIPLVATNPIEFEKRSDFRSNEIRICDQKKTTLYDVNRPDYSTSEQYFKTTQEMEKVFKGIEFALDNTVAIANKCNVEIELYNNFLPNFETGTDENEVDYFRRLSLEGFERRMREIFPNENDYQKNYANYLNRLEGEMKVIIDMKFPGYFLIVQDFIQYAKKNGVPVGPGRGSGAGSLVAYSLGITDVDPIKYDLLFERFLNPERVSMPDFDIDFAQDNEIGSLELKDGRTKVINYVRDKYGSNVVSQILALQNLKPKALLKAVGRTLLVNQLAINNLTKTITKAEELDSKMTLEKLYEVNENFRNAIDEDETLGEIYRYAVKMHTMPKSISQHAAGVIIASKDLNKVASIYLDEKCPPIIQLDKVYSEHAGLVKFDFLGLKTLNIIDDTIKKIKEQKGIDIDISKINLDDPEVIDLFRKGDTFGIFQFEASGIQRMIQKIKPTSFEDVTAATALNRPGPLEAGMAESFILRKNGEEDISYPLAECNLPQLEPILGKTYGLIVYQEQVMQIPQLLAGYTLGGADLLRRAMGKKKPEEMEKQRSVFVDGCLKHSNIPEEVSSKLFDIIEKFAGYGFNKSHSVSYTVLSMQTAYLKKHYPEYFLTEVFNRQDKDLQKEKTIKDIRDHGIKLVAPNINKSDFLMTVKDGIIYYGFKGIKGVPDSIVLQIVEERKANGDFKDFNDFYERTYKFITKAVVEKLIKAGAFKDFNPNQNEMIYHLDAYKKVADKLKKQELKETSGLNNMLTRTKKKTTKSQNISFREIEWEKQPETTQLESSKYEFQVLGFYLETDPMLGFIEKFNGLKAMNTIQDYREMDVEGYMPMNIAGVVSAVIGRKGGKFVEILGEADRNKFEEEVLDAVEIIDEALKEEKEMISIDEEEMSSENEETEKEEKTIDKRKQGFYIRDDVFEKNKNKIKEGQFIVLDGTVSKSKNSAFGKNSIWVNAVYSEKEMEERLVNEINILVNPQDPKGILPILERHQGRIPVTLYLPAKDGKNFYSSRVKKEHYVNGSIECIEELRRELGNKAIVLNYKDKLIIEENNQRNFGKKQFGR